MTWKMVNLGDIGKIVSGSTPKTNNPANWNGKINWITPAEIIKGYNGYIFESDRKLSDEGFKSSNLTLLPKGAVLLTSRAPIGKVALVGEPMCTNQGFKSIICDQKLVNSEYLYHYLVTRYDQLNDLGRGATFKEVSKTIVEKVKIPLPPLETQERIVTLLDKALELIDKRKEQITLMDQLIQSLFYDMFGDPVSNPMGWETGCIKDLAVKTQYGSGKKAHESEGNFPILRMNNITYSGAMDFSSLKYIDLDANEQKKYLVHKGEILFNRTNSKELVGKTAMFDQEIPMAYAGYLVKLIVNEKAVPQYVSAYLNSKHGKAVLLNMAKSIVGMANINAEELKKIKINIPPIELQSSFAERVNEIKMQKEAMTVSLKELENNFNSLMQRAFKGELDV
jgi:type I restriction enzyme, S subunit